MSGAPLELCNNINPLAVLVEEEHKRTDSSGMRVLLGLIEDIISNVLHDFFEDNYEGEQPLDVAIDQVIGTFEDMPDNISYLIKKLKELKGESQSDQGSAPSD